MEVKATKRDTGREMLLFSRCSALRQRVRLSPQWLDQSMHQLSETPNRIQKGSLSQNREPVAGSG